MEPHQSTHLTIRAVFSIQYQLCLLSSNMFTMCFRSVFCWMLMCFKHVEWEILVMEKWRPTAIHCFSVSSSHLSLAHICPSPFSCLLTLLFSVTSFYFLIFFFPPLLLHLHPFSSCAFAISTPTGFLHTNSSFSSDGSESSWLSTECLRRSMNIATQRVCVSVCQSDALHVCICVRDGRLHSLLHSSRDYEWMCMCGTCSLCWLAHTTTAMPYAAVNDCDFKWCGE